MRYVFADFVLDLRRRTLERGGRDIVLGHRAFGVLSELVTRAGSVVSKSELLDTVWDDAVVGEDNLTKAVGEIRTALGDSPAEARFVRTVHRRGYLFVAQVSLLEDVAEPPSSVSVVETAAAGPGLVRRSSVITAAAATVVVLVVIALLLRLGLHEADDPDSVSLPFVDWKLGELQGAPAGLIKPSFSPTGDTLAAVMPDPTTGIHSLYLLASELEQPLQLTRDIEVRGPSPVFAADGRWVWFTTYRHGVEGGLVPAVMRVPAVGGTPQLLVDGASSACPSPDGRSMVVARVGDAGTSICVRTPSGEERSIAETGYWPRYSPDGQWIAYTTSNPEGGNGLVWVVRLDGSDRRRLNREPSQLYGLCWSPDSRHVVYASDADGAFDLWIVGLDRSTPLPVTRSPGICTSPSVSPDGARLVFAFAMVDTVLHLAPKLSDPPRELLNIHGIVGATLSPDGTQVALVAEPHSGAPPVSVLDIGSGVRHMVSSLRCRQIRWQLSGAALLATAPSPDGSATWVWRIPVDGAASTPLTTGPGHWAWPDLAPDGRRLAAARRVAKGWEVTLVDLETGAVTVVAHSGEARGLRWSPDGSMLAWCGGNRPADRSSSGIWVAVLEDGTVRQVAADGAWPAWQATGRSLVFVRFLDRAGLWSVPVDPATELPELSFIAALATTELEGVDVGRDGGPLLLLAATSTSVLYTLQPPETPGH